jgi:hypothetical protein
VALARPIVAAAPLVLLFEKFGFANLEHPWATTASPEADPAHERRRQADA